MQCSQSICANEAVQLWDLWSETKSLGVHHLIKSKIYKQIFTVQYILLGLLDVIKCILYHDHGNHVEELFFKTLLQRVVNSM